MSKLISVFPNSDLRSGHRGLGIKASKHKVDTKTLSPGDLVLFLNRAQTAFKALATNNILLHYKHERGMLNMEAIKFLPYCMGEESIELSYSKALEAALHKTLKKK